ncbi:MAG: fructose-6-phosphate aldolase [Thermoplasmatota archaeon]
MKLFLDTGNVDEIRKADAWGVLDGVTTNPSLVAKEGRDFKKLIEEICTITKGPVSAEVVSEKADDMVREAIPLTRLAPNVIIKVPLTPEGIRATHLLSKQGIKVNVTLCFSPSQALLAAKAGAAYISPFVGRLDDYSMDGMDLIRKIRAIYDNYAYDTEILVASVRHPEHVVQAAMMGADVATIPFKVLEQMFRHPQTDLGVAAFLKDWEKAVK